MSTPNQENDQGNENNADENKEDQSQTVDLATHKRTSQDMMKYKTERNTLQQQYNALKTKVDAEKVEELKGKEEWKEVAERYEKEKQALVDEKAAMHATMITNHIKAAVIEGVGGFIKPSYADHAIAVDNVTMNDGIIDQDSLKSEIERIKRDERPLLKSSFTGNLPNNASNPNGFQDKEYKDMTSSEKYAYKRKLHEQID